MELSKSKLKYIQSLRIKKNRDEHLTFVAEGDKMVSDILSSMKCQLLVATPEFIGSIDLNKFDVQEIIEVSKAEIGRASSLKNPQQVLGVFYQPVYDFDIVSLKKKLNLALDGVQDPGNLGTIMRLADWYGIEDIFCSKDTVDLYNPKVVQASMGALARVKVHYVDLPFLFSQLTDFPIYGTFLNGQDLYQSDLTTNGIVVMGNEGSGIRIETTEKVTKKLYIPNYPQGHETSESLNVAIATSIICSEFRRRMM